jgi:hypothetical protein
LESTGAITKKTRHPDFSVDWFGIIESVALTRVVLQLVIYFDESVAIERLSLSPFHGELSTNAFPYVESNRAWTSPPAGTQNPPAVAGSKSPTMMP